MDGRLTGGAKRVSRGSGTPSPS